MSIKPIVEVRAMPEIVKTEDGIFIPKELIPDFEHVTVDISEPHKIVVRSPQRRHHLDEVIARIDEIREDIRRRKGTLDDSSILIREDRDSEDR
jgi:hypothetical protein